MDNLIADGKAVPMIIVMPNGRAQENSKDNLMYNSSRLKAFCDENGVPCTLIEYPEGQHDFVVWKYGLYQFTQLIFK